MTHADKSDWLPNVQCILGAIQQTWESVSRLIRKSRFESRIRFWPWRSLRSRSAVLTLVIRRRVTTCFCAFVFLPRDVMHKRGLCRRAVSVRPSGCLSRSCIVSKRVNISSNVFHRRVATTSYFSVQNVMVIFRRGTSHGGIEAGAVKKSRFSTTVSRYLGNDTR